MRVATCTPVDFPADVQFFGRDSGLLCRGFQAAGHDAFVVMPGAVRASDEPGVVRCTVEELASDSWWRSMGLELVVLYAWGDPRYRRIAEAIRAAGIVLVQSLDTAGLRTPWGNFKDWSHCTLDMIVGQTKPIRMARLITKAFRDLIPSAYEKKRLSMIDCSDHFAVVSPPTARSVGNYATKLGYPEIAAKTLVVPHPVSMAMKPTDAQKLPKVLVVGRWTSKDRAQKDPVLTMAVVGRFLEACPAWNAEVVGRGSTALKKHTQSWSEDASQRLVLTEAVPRADLIERYQQASILLCCSRHESFHISSAEALCCGCSIVVAEHPLLASTGWFTTKDSGTLSPSRSACALTTALISEVDAWRQGRRDPRRISSEWRKLLHADQVASGLLAALRLR